jgi:hypothetical protein
MKNSGGPNERTMILTNGIRTRRKTMPIIDPSIDDDVANPIARPASPRRAMGWPSKQVAALGASPGLLRRMAGTEPPSVAAPIIPAIRNIEGAGCQPNVKVIPMVRPARKRPGNAPRIRPATAPTARMNRFAGWLSWPRASTSAVSMMIYFPLSNPCIWNPLSSATAVTIALG